MRPQDIQSILHENKSSREKDMLASGLEVPPYEGEPFDRALQSVFSKYWGSLSPISAFMAVQNWISHLAISPAKQQDLFRKASKQLSQLSLYYFERATGKTCMPCIHSRTEDRRFKNEDWNKFPFDLYVQLFLIAEHLGDEATRGVRGVSEHHENMVNFFSRQLFDLLSPSNYFATNPEVLKATIENGGKNLMQGYINFSEDWLRSLSDQPPVGTEKFVVGENLGITPGKVVYRNHLIELIQYEPKTEKVFKEPILFVPAWIMKYYILDLSPHNSLVKYLVEQGHTVFMISWRNPGTEDRNLEFEDYANLGIAQSIQAIHKIMPDVKINAAGYCLGGTLLMIYAASLAAKSDDTLNSITLFAAQVDFKDAGELQLFIDESQVAYLEDIMWPKGYLEGSHMAWAFSMLRSSELIWSRLVRDYLIGERESLIDLIAWDQDTTRLPYKMHTQYLRKLFLNNLLVQGKFSLHGKRVALSDITTPIFAVSTVTDHVAPWRSVYKVHLYTKSDVTFVLTTGGHNAGIISEPTSTKRRYQMMTRTKGEKYLTTDHWHEIAPQFSGSWWPAWQNWLVEHSQGEMDLPTMGSESLGQLYDAPGYYVFQK